MGLAAALGAPCGAQAQAPPSFPSEVELITVDAVVLDAAGHPVPGLTRDDFVISEDGRPQPIVSFEAFALESRAAEQSEPGPVASNESGARRLDRAFALLLDDLQLSPPQAVAARQAAAVFVERTLRDGDEVTLATTSGDTWWSARVPEGREDLLAVLARVKGHAAETPSLDRMSEYEAYRIANFEDAPGISDGGPGLGVTLQGGSAQAEQPLPSGGQGATVQRVRKRWQDALLCVGRQCDSMVRARAAEIDSRREARLRDTFRALRRQLDALAAAHGRKSLLFLSNGFVHGAGALRRLAADSREANTAIYFLDLRGLIALPGFGSAADPGRPPEAPDQAAMRFEDIALASAGAETLADDTGGFAVRNTNDLAGSAGRIANESRVFYLLGFQPPAGKPAGQWRKLSVTVKRPGLTVRARRGYTLRRTGAERAAQPAKGKGEPGVAAAVARALDSVPQQPGIPLRAMAYVFEPRPKDTTHVVVAAEFDAGSVTLQPKGSKRVGRVEVSVVALERDSGRGFRHDDTVEVAFDGGEMPGWRAFAREFELPAGVAQVRVVVHDPVSGTVGSVWQRLEVPARGTLRLSTPILSDHAEPAPGGNGSPRPALAAHRVFPPAGRLYCQFQVFGATPLGGGGDAHVSAGLELRRGDQLVREAAPTPIQADPDGRIVRLVGLALDGLQEGDYELRLLVQDAVSGAHLERREPFTLAQQTAAR